MIHNPFPRYVEFTDFTPVIPELYWNVYSSEERIRALCLEWVKLTAYVDDMAETVNDQYAIIKDMQERLPELIDEEIAVQLRALVQSGEFDELIEQALARYWAEYENRIVSVESGIQTLNGDVDNLERQDDIIKSRNIVLIGDSWTDPNSVTVEDDVNWVSIWKQIYRGDTIYNFASAGRGVLVGNPNFLQQVNNAYADTSFNNDDIDLVIIVGDINDWSTHQAAADYSTQLRLIAQDVSRYFVNAQPYFFFASCARPLCLNNNNTTGNWNDLLQLNEELCRFINETMPSSLGTSSRLYRKMKAFNITHIFTEQTFKPWGNPDYMRHLSQYGHWQLFKGIDHCITTGSEPWAYGSLNYAIADETSPVSKVMGTFRYTANRFESTIEVTLRSALTAGGQTYIEIPNSAFEVAGSATPTRFLSNFDDMFPPADTSNFIPIRYNTNPIKYNPLLSRSMKLDISRNVTSGSIFKSIVAFFGTPLFASAGPHGLFIKYNASSDNPIPSGAYFGQFSYDLGEWSPAYLYME